MESTLPSTPAPAPTAPAPKPSAPTAAPAQTQPKYSRAKTFTPGLYRINLLEPETGRYGVQVGSFSALESALDKVVELQAKYFDDILLHKIGRGDKATYKVILGPFGEQNSAQRYASDLKRRYGIQGFTVDLNE